MAGIHYKLPLDEEVDKDIIDWIDNLPRMKKGEMVRHAIRYYMTVLGEGEMIKFPNINTPMVAKQESTPSSVPQPKREKQRPTINVGGLKGKE